MTTFIFEYSSPALYKVVEYRSRCRKLGENVERELREWGIDTARYFSDNEKSATLTAYTEAAGRHVLTAYETR